MKPLLVILAICAAGYVTDHWQQLTVPHSSSATSAAHVLIIYGSKTCPACVRLEGALHQQGISYQKCDLAEDANFRELIGKLARVGKMGGRIAIPVAEVDGVLVEGASIEQITKRLK